MSFAGHPLVFRGEIMGVLAVFSRERLATSDFRWLRTLADQAAIAIANARAFEEIERLRSQLESENSYLREEVNKAHAFGEIVGQRRVAAQAARTNRSSGTDAGECIDPRRIGNREGIGRSCHSSTESAMRTDVGESELRPAISQRDLFESESFLDT